MTTGEQTRYRQYAEADERTHQPGEDPRWQESFFLVWYDPDRDVGGVHRIAHEPRRDGGRSVLQCDVFGPNKRFRRTDGDLSLEPPVEPGGFRAGGSTWSVSDGVGTLSINESALTAELTTTNFYPITDFFPSGGSMVEDFAPAHYETAGRITGPVTIEGQRIDVDGFYYRDHSWGIRKWDTMLAHRWVVGTFGPQLSFAAVTWYAADGSFIKAGYIRRDGEVIYAEDVDIVTWMEADAVSLRGGELTLTLPGDERFHLTLHNVAATGNEHHGGFYVDAMCTTEYRGVRGVADFEISANPRAGSRPVTFSLNANIVNGLSERVR